MNLRRIMLEACPSKEGTMQVERTLAEPWCSNAIFCLIWTYFAWLLEISHQPKTITGTFTVFPMDTSLSFQKKGWKCLRKGCSGTKTLRNHSDCSLPFSRESPLSRFHSLPASWPSSELLHVSAQKPASSCKNLSFCPQGRLTFSHSFVVTSTPLPSQETVGKHSAGTGTAPEVNNI